MPRAALDRALHRAGLPALKSRLFRRETALPDGQRILYRPGDRKIIDEVYSEGAYSAAEMREDDVILDVGAHIGVFALYAARRVPKGRVICVEPAPLNRALLLENLALNGLRDVKVHDCGVAAEPGEARLYLSGDDALHSLLRSDSPSVPIRLSTIDAIAQAEGIESCGLLKLDVEGAELSALEGAARTLERTRQVLVEAGKAGEQHLRVRALLERAGFRCATRTDTPGGVVYYAWR